jgi:hypothetical protein
MGKYPVIQSPSLDEVEKRMATCRPWQPSFLGNDERKLIQILDSDHANVISLGLTDGEIAGRLRDLTFKAREGLGDPVCAESKFLLKYQDARGKLSCPWGHPGLYPKTHVECKNIETGEVLVWTDLSIHFIQDHGFYEGKGSPYRLDPKTIKRVLEL